MCDLYEPAVFEITGPGKNTQILGSIGYFCQNLEQHCVNFTVLKRNEISAIQITAHTSPVTTDEYSRSGSHLQLAILPSSQSTARAEVQKK